MEQEAQPISIDDLIKENNKYYDKMQKIETLLLVVIEQLRA